MMQKKQNILFVIAFGPELRPFINSGIFKSLNSDCTARCLIKDSAIAAKIDILRSESVLYYKKQDVVNKANSFFIKVFSRFESWFQKIRQARKRRLGFGNYHFTKGSDFNRNTYDRFLGSEFIYKWFNKIYSLVAPLVYNSPYFVNLLRQHGITDILYYGSNIAEMKSIQQAAKNEGVKLWHYVGNWKDIYIDDHIPVIPERIFVWSEQQKSDLIKFNPTIIPEKVIVTGNWFFHTFKNYSRVNSKQYYSTKYNFEQNRPLILWPLSMKVVFPNEHLLLQALDQFIESMQIPSKPVIVLRDNPFGAASDLVDYYNNLVNVRLASNYWQVSRADDFTFQTNEGEQEWLDLLYHSDFIISTPSTVTLESILMKKTCLNILFDESGNYSEKIAAFAKAPFYQDLLQRTDVKMVNSLEELKRLLLYPETIMGSNELPLPDIISGNRDCNIGDIVKILTS